MLFRVDYRLKLFFTRQSFILDYFSLSGVKDRLKSHSLLELGMSCLIQIRIGDRGHSPSSVTEIVPIHVFSGKVGSDFVLRRPYVLIYTLVSLFRRLNFSMRPWQTKCVLDFVAYGQIHCGDVSCNDCLISVLILKFFYLSICFLFLIVAYFRDALKHAVLFFQLLL